MDIEKISRRSFIKKTTVLAVGVVSVTLFSGLVNAATSYLPGDGWSCKKMSGTGNGCTNQDSDGYWHCTCEDGSDAICVNKDTPAGAWIWCRTIDNRKE